jgi:hypothetical protein
MATYTGIVRRTSTIATWRHLFAESNIGYGRFLTLLNAEITVYRAGNSRMNCFSNKSVKSIS